MIGTEDLEKMTTLEITKKLVSLFEEYDSLRDDELNMLDENPHRDMWDKGTEDTYDTLVKDIVDKYELAVITTCSMGIIEFDCETMLGKPCCRASHNCYYPIEKLVEMFNNMKFNVNEICKDCLYAELFDNDSSEETTETPTDNYTPGT